MPRKNPPAADRLVTRKEIAEIYQVGTHAVHTWDKKGILPPPIRLTRKTLRYRLSEVRAALEGRR
jgi:predicted DNA-binding transcriptional regulator AlpA